MSIFQSIIESFGRLFGISGVSCGPSGSDLGIDLGTANTLVCTASKGIVLREPSVVAVDMSRTPPEVIEVGLVAKDMIGRTPPHIKATRPLKDGVIAEFEWAEVMLQRFIAQANGESGLMSSRRPGRIVIGLPSGVTEVERRAVGDAAYNAGASIVNLVPEPMAAALGANMPVDQPMGSMIIDIGGGTTEIAVLSLNGIVVSKSLRIAGDHLTQSIQIYLKKEYGLSVGEPTAENVKITLGSAHKKIDKTALSDMKVRGLSATTGLPDTVTVTAQEVRDCLDSTLMQMVEGIKETLEETPPELAADVMERGIILAGGGALLPGMADLVASEVDVPVTIADEPLACVVLGTEKLLNDPAYKGILELTEYDTRY